MLAELIATRGVVEELDLAGSLGVMALHGGLEAGTADAARRTAAAVGASSYVLMQPDDLAWHVPSIEYDPRQSPRLRRFLDHISFAVSFHGFGRRGMEDTVLLGGRNRRIAGLLAAAITRRSRLTVIDDPELMPASLRGMHPSNPVNLPENGGVQLELSPGARTPEALEAIIDAIAAVLQAEAASVCPAPSS